MVSKEAFRVESHKNSQAYKEQQSHEIQSPKKQELLSKKRVRPSQALINQHGSQLLQQQSRPKPPIITQNLYNLQPHAKTTTINKQTLTKSKPKNPKKIITIEQINQIKSKPGRKSKKELQILELFKKQQNQLVKRGPGRPPKLTSIRKSRYYRQKAQLLQQQQGIYDLQQPILETKRGPGRPKKSDTLQNYQIPYNNNQYLVQQQDIKSEKILQNKKVANQYLRPSQYLQLKRKMKENPQDYQDMNVNDMKINDIKKFQNYKKRGSLRRPYNKSGSSVSVSASRVSNNNNIGLIPQDDYKKRGRKRVMVIVDVINPFYIKKLTLNNVYISSLQSTINTHILETPQQFLKDIRQQQNNKSAENECSSTNNLSENSNNNNNNENNNNNNINNNQNYEILLQILEMINQDLYGLENIIKEFRKMTVENQEVNLYQNDAKFAYLLKEAAQYNNYKLFIEYCVFIGLMSKLINRKQILVMQQTHTQLFGIAEYLKDCTNYTSIDLNEQKYEEFCQLIFKTEKRMTKKQQNQFKNEFPTFMYFNQYEFLLKMINITFNCIFNA